MLAVKRFPRKTKTLGYYQRLVEEAIALVRRRACGPMTLGELADAAGMSRYHFIRVFRQIAGIPPMHFLHACRIDQARRLLLTTDRSVTDICLDVGYSSLGSFTSRFTELVGLSPRRLRRRWNSCSRADTAPQVSGWEESEPGVNCGRVMSDEGEVAIGVVGMFRAESGLSKPVECARVYSGRFALGALPEGMFRAFAVGFVAGDDLDSLIRSGQFLRGASGPFEISGGQAHVSLDLRIRRPKLTDPPVLWAGPLLPARTISRDYTPAFTKDLTAPVMS